MSNSIVSLYRCKSGHYHFIDEDWPMWPFWSLSGGRLILKAHEQVLPTKVQVREQLTLLLEEEAARQERLAKGRFGKLILPRHDELDVPRFEIADWINFWTGKNEDFTCTVLGAKTIQSNHWVYTGRETVVQILCDFIDHSSGRPNRSRIDSMVA